MYLDGIFTESIDIRLQLPEEAKKFETINRRFLSIMKQTSENPNVLSAFCLENRLGEMKGLAAELDSCQRSLSDYLDAKRIMYPRLGPCAKFAYLGCPDSRSDAAHRTFGFTQLVPRLLSKAPSIVFRQAR